MLRNIFRASAITKRHLMLNRAVFARGSTNKKEPEKTQQSQEDEQNNQKVSKYKIRMRSHYEFETKKEGLLN